MEIQLSPRHPHSIRAYSDTAVSIGEQTYTQSLCLNTHKIHYPWAAGPLAHLSLAQLEPLDLSAIKIIIIGHKGSGFAPLSLMAELSRLGIGLECMSIAAACRTFNVLLDEKRAVGLGLLFS